MARDTKDIEEGIVTHNDAYVNGNDHYSGDGTKGAALQRMITAGTLPPDVFERLYLQPQNTVAGDLRSRFGNPTAVGVMGFTVGITPLSIALMGWRGAGGSAVATTGPTLFFGGMLLILAGVGEWILGNNFPFIVFMGYGAHFLSFGTTFIPYYNAVTAYSENGLHASQFYASFGFYPVAMCLLSFVFLIGALRTNLIFFLVFVVATLGFAFASAGFFSLALANNAYGETMIVATGACFFVAGILGWYLFAALIIEIQEIPIPSLPLFDLSTKVKAKSLVRAAKEAKRS
ncbi:hypothetical protein LTR62_003676 [Meristemomyces frigidus]|uniref:Protein alcS n=1 Tax=Meristemomyces frigidus TaxID=1508187 RepID=A0AAN7TRL5_9PEZI|nr:hypothetical protein LTR62_003676 [Meristemomyces frigidus]